MRVSNGLGTVTALANEQEESRRGRHDDAEEGEAQWWLQLMPVDGFLLLEPAAPSLKVCGREGINLEPSLTSQQWRLQSTNAVYWARGRSQPPPPYYGCKS